MKQFLVKHFAIAALAICAVPGTLLAQTDKEKEKAKEKTSRQQIVITRTGDKEEKTVIEIDGDKVKVNGKDVADLKDVQVHINNLRTTNGTTFRTPGNFSLSFDDASGHLFSVDSNRAMLGVVTEGDEKGAQIQSITKESAAEKAGLKKGDIITKIDTRKIDATDDVSDAVRAHKPGEKVSITYLRDGKEQKASAELGRWKGMNMQSFSMPEGFNQMWKNNQLDQLRGQLDNQSGQLRGQARGLSIAPRIQMNGEYIGNRPRLGLSVQDTDNGKGVKVLDIDEEGSAAKAGIKEGDIITQVDDKAVSSADEVSKLIREKKDQPTVKMQVARGGKTQTFDVRMKKPKTVDL